MPRIESAQALERALDALASDFNQIVRESPEARQSGTHNAIVSHLSGIDEAARHATPPLQQAVLALTAEARQRLVELEAALDSERSVEQHLRETTQRINSLNADFNEELASLAQDIGWQEWTLVEAVARGGESGQLRRSEQSLRALQRQRQLINSVARVEAQVVEDLFRFLAARTAQEVERTRRLPDRPAAHAGRSDPAGVAVSRHGGRPTDRCPTLGDRHGAVGIAGTAERARSFTPGAQCGDRGA
ncbi:MAG: hypothetical protein QM803_17795 [Rhodocyclaceae bacterium]